MTTGCDVCLGLDIYQLIFIDESAANETTKAAFGFGSGARFRGSFRFNLNY